MSWAVVDRAGRKVEGETRYYSPSYACRAMQILNAHELKNGRVAQYSIVPPIDLIPIEQLDLPTWALEVLRKEGL